MSKLREAIDKANEAGIDTEVVEKRTENLRQSLSSLYEQRLAVNEAINQYSAMNREQRRLKQNKEVYKQAVVFKNALEMRIRMFEQVDRELKAKS